MFLYLCVKNDDLIPWTCACIKKCCLHKKIDDQQNFSILQPTVDIEIFPTTIEDWSENSAEDITQEDIDKMIVKYPAIRGSSKSVINPDIIAGMCM